MLNKYLKNAKSVQKKCRQCIKKCQTCIWKMLQMCIEKNWPSIQKKLSCLIKVTQAFEKYVQKNVDRVLKNS